MTCKVCGIDKTIEVPNNFLLISMTALDKIIMDAHHLASPKCAGMGRALRVEMKLSG